MERTAMWKKNPLLPFSCLVMPIQGVRRFRWTNPLRVSSTSSPLWLAMSTGGRYIASEHTEITVPNHSDHHHPPSVISSPPSSSAFSSSSAHPVSPMDFNPHIEWFEYPKEIFDPKYPYTREESIRMTEEAWDSTMEEMASRYGMKLNMTTKPTFWMAWMIMVFYAWYTLWGCYRAMGLEPGWSHFKDIVLQSPHPPTIEEDDIYLDQWMRPEMREKFSRYERFWNWKPLVKRDGGAQTSWKKENERLDVSEWKHMTSAN